MARDRTPVRIKTAPHGDSIGCAVLLRKRITEGSEDFRDEPLRRAKTLDEGVGGRAVERSGSETKSLSEVWC